MEEKKAYGGYLQVSVILKFFICKNKITFSSELVSLELNNKKKKDVSSSQLKASEVPRWLTHTASKLVLAVCGRAPFLFPYNCPRAA